MQRIQVNNTRRGVTLVETTIALGLLVALMSVMASLAVRNQRVLADNRAYRLAVDELSNQLDMLTALPADEAATALEALSGEEPVGPVTGATLRGKMADEDYGRRLTVTLSWPAAIKRRPDVTLSAWSFVEDDSTEDQL
ncbi:type IV pilus modification PilV family protein [Botrimarina mediterranea]|uniref:Prepilin-type N-terminal cleavage/methylation domain-containing protein n=1 Tax=Botrimarina mediterranea TaxID=2528022 RepID=A0A518KA49_9BACT|nr:hypothetical protein [Botrimarina mediterranea]QDV74661.1 hypothetical protein Spa11_28680 [Botrimarina mediterranea]QDV79298.1 hypothetical protein K2D_29120 [Planctomycetes bacterium K2D]